MVFTIYGHHGNRVTSPAGKEYSGEIELVKDHFMAEQIAKDPPSKIRLAMIFRVQVMYQT